MAKFQRNSDELSKDSVNICFICHEYMGSIKNDFSGCTSYSQKSLCEIFESFTCQKIPNHVIFESAVCQNCFIKFNEYDEHSSIASKVQSELMLLYSSSFRDEEDIKPNIEHHNDFGMVQLMLEQDEESLEDEVYNQSEQPVRCLVKSERRAYKRKKNLDEGLKVVEIDGTKIYQCDICKKLCKDRYKLKTHKEIHRTDRSVCCNECGAMFKTLTCLYSHKKIHRDRVYHQCDHCEMRYIQKTQLRKHMDAIHLKKKDHVCSICGKCYSRDTTLSKHLFVHKEEKDVVCTVCGFRTHTKPKMERHMKSHTGERNYSCKLCDKRFLYSYNVTAHVKHVHNREKRKIDEEKLTCKFCGKRFQKIWKVKEHMAEVHQLAEGVLLIKDEEDRKYLLEDEESQQHESYIINC